MLQPLRGKVLVEIIPEHRQTESGLWIAETVKEIPCRGKILAIGAPFMDRKGKEVAWECRVSETVHFKRKWSGFKKEGEKEVVILTRGDIVAFERDGIQAMGDFVVVRRHYMGGVGGGSIILSSDMGVQQNYEDFYGEVLSIGPLNTFRISKGDKILYHRNEGSRIDFEGKELFVLKPRAILAKLELFKN